MKTKRRTESGAWSVKIENGKRLRLLAKRAAKSRGMLVSAWVAEAIRAQADIGLVSRDPSPQHDEPTHSASDAPPVDPAR